VSEQAVLTKKFKFYNEYTEKKLYLKLATVVHACLIKETIDLLPLHPLEKK